MNTRIQETCNLFIKNKEIIRKGFTWEHTLMHCLCAFQYTNVLKEADPAKIKECKALIKKNTPLFSHFKDISLLSMATSLSLSENPQEHFQDILKVYDLLKEKGFKSSTYLTTAALSIVENAEKYNYNFIADKSFRIYQSMKNEHPLLTSKDDYGFAVMLAMSDLNVPELINGMEECFALLKGNFFSSDAVQSLSHVLTLSTEDPKAKCDRVMKIFNILKSKGNKYGTGNELASLGILALISSDADYIAETILEVSEFLRTQKGFGAFSVGRAQRLMYAAAITASENIHEMQDGSLHSSLSSVVTKSIIAIETAIIATTIACTATVVTTSSNSNS